MVNTSYSLVLYTDIISDIGPQNATGGHRYNTKEMNRSVHLCRTRTEEAENGNIFSSSEN
jgi:hypothetical protein